MKQDFSYYNLLSDHLVVFRKFIHFTENILTTAQSFGFHFNPIFPLNGNIRTVQFIRALLR